MDKIVITHTGRPFKEGDQYFSFYSSAESLFNSTDFFDSESITIFKSELHKKNEYPEAYGIEVSLIKHDIDPAPEDEIQMNTAPEYPDLEGYQKPGYFKTLLNIFRK